MEMEYQAHAKDHDTLHRFVENSKSWTVFPTTELRKPFQETVSGNEKKTEFIYLSVLHAHPSHHMYIITSSSSVWHFPLCDDYIPTWPDGCKYSI
jgi:hypothetical protein